MIDGQKFDWTEGDIFCLPIWASHKHLNPSPTEDAILFSMNDSPVLQSLGIYREAAHEDRNGQ